ncbi:MAG: hypothetical protein H8D23_37970 [Candidatus Brocadiales bacterium]|nr:hypothetical protein [Candidatus Brocadiales bacterium]
MKIKRKSRMTTAIYGFKAIVRNRMTWEYLYNTNSETWDIPDSVSLIS